MPGFAGNIADLLASDPFESETAFVRLALAGAVCCALLAALGIAVCLGYCRSLANNRLRRQLERNTLPSSRLQPGMQGQAECMASGSTDCLPACLVWVGRRYVELEMPGSSRIRPGTPVRVSLRSQGALLAFTTQVADRRRDMADRLFLRRPEWVERIQRRNAFRVPITLPTAVSYLPADSQKSRTIGCLLTDLSATGACLASPEPLAPGTRLRVQVPISESSEAMLDARTLRSSLVPRHDHLDHRVACEFVRLPESAHEALIRYCFHVERVQRSVGAKEETSEPQALEP